MMKLEDVFEYQFGQAGATDSGLWCCKLKCRVDLVWNDVTVREGTQVGESSGHKKKKDAEEVASQQALDYLIRELSPHLTRPSPPPPPPPPRVASGEAGSYTFATAAATPEQLAPLFEILQEESESYQRMIAVHVRTCGLDDADLIRWAWTKLDQADAEPVGHSAGRRFHDLVERLARGE
jgi:hypothetical protein